MNFKIRTLNDNVLEYEHMFRLYDGRIERTVNQYWFKEKRFNKFKNNKLTEIKEDGQTYKKAWTYKEYIDPYWGNKKYKRTGYIFKPTNAPSGINPEFHKLETGKPLIAIYAGKPFRFHLIIVGYDMYALPQHKELDMLLQTVQPLTYVKIEYLGKRGGKFKKARYHVYTGDKSDPFGQDPIYDHVTSVTKQRSLSEFLGDDYYED